MWELEEFDKRTTRLTRRFELPRLTTDDVQRLLGLGETVKIGDHHYPLEAGGYDVPDLLVLTFASYGDIRGVPLLRMDYQVAHYYRDEN